MHVIGNPPSLFNAHRQFFSISILVNGELLQWKATLSQWIFQLTSPKHVGHALCRQFSLWTACMVKNCIVLPAFRCETGRENAVVRVISLTIQSVYSVAMLWRLKAYNRPGSGLSKTVMNHTRKWLRVKLKLNQVAKLQKHWVAFQNVLARTRRSPPKVPYLN